MKLCSLFVFAIIGEATAFVIKHHTFSTNNQRDSFALFVAEPKQVKGGSSDTNRNLLTPAQRLLIKNSRLVNFDTVASPSRFDALKNVAYAVGDGLTSLGRKSSKPKTDQIFDGYADMRGRNAASSSPTQRLLEALQKRPPPSEVVEVKVKPTQTRSIFDSFKGALYGTADIASSVAHAAASTTTMPSASETPVMKPVTGNPKSQIVLRKETFGNPFQRLSAEIQDNVKQQTKLVSDGIDKLKTDVTVAGDFFSTTASDIQAVPGQLHSFLEETVDKTIQAVEDIKALPMKVQQKVESTKQSVQEAVEVVEEVSTSAKVLLGLEKPKPRPPKSTPSKTAGPEELVWHVAGSVLNGAGRAVWWMGSGAAGLTWNAVKGQIQKDQVNAGSVDDQLKTSPMTAAFMSSKVMEMAASKVTSSEASTLLDQLVAKSTSESISCEDEKFNLEIAEALQLADEALAMVSESSKLKSTASLDDELNQEIEAALLLAQEALAAAEA